MVTIRFNEGHKAVLDDMLLGLPEVRPGKMFGYPGYFAGPKLCICVYEDSVGLKLPQHTAERLLQTDDAVVPFVPLGKHRMRQWIQIDEDDSEEYRGYASVFEESIHYVLSLQQGA